MLLSSVSNGTACLWHQLFLKKDCGRNRNQLWDMSGEAATSISTPCWPEAQGNTTVPSGCTPELPLHWLSCYAQLIIQDTCRLHTECLTMLVRVLSINAKPGECCFFWILSEECYETELLPTWGASRAQYSKHCSCHCTWMASLDILIYPSPQAYKWRRVLHTFICLKRFNLKTLTIEQYLNVYVL